jgi:hypothetical protein
MLVVAAFGLSAALGYASGVARNHVRVEVFNIDAYEAVFVNCHEVGTRGHVLTAGDDNRTLDLGWLAPQDLITFQSRNDTGSFAWGFKLLIDDRPPIVDEAGSAAPGAQGAYDGLVRPYQLTHRRTYDATGGLVGDTGCQGPDPLAATRPAVAGRPPSVALPASVYAVAAWLLAHLSLVLVAFGALVAGRVAIMSRDIRGAIFAVPAVVAIIQADDLQLMALVAAGGMILRYSLQRCGVDLAEIQRWLNSMGPDGPSAADPGPPSQPPAPSPGPPDAGLPITGS